MRPIDADAIPYTMLYKENWLKGTGIEKLGVWKDTIDAMSTIEPEQKKGHWIMKWHNFFQRELPTCSECGAGSVFKTKFCHECGVDMRGEENGSIN